jgi:hypothetical protein
MPHHHNTIPQGHALFTACVLMNGLLLLGSGLNITHAQLSRCTNLQQGSIACDNPSGRSSLATDALRELQGSGSSQEKKDGLGDFGRGRASQLHRVPLETDAEPILPPINGARDYLNRSDPAHSIQPLQPMAPVQQGLGSR